MNIIVKTVSGRCYCRPDTSWEREDKDLFSPDHVNSFLYSPVLFARICKAGKCVGRKFAGRYYDSVGYGMLLYAGDMFDGSPLSYASSSCLDHTSVLPFPMYNRITLEEKSNAFVLQKDGKEIFSFSDGNTDMIEDAISEATMSVSVRIGDMIAIELAGPAILSCRENPEQGGENRECKNEIRGSFCGNGLFCFNIIF